MRTIVNILVALIASLALTASSPGQGQVSDFGEAQMLMQLGRFVEAAEVFRRSFIGLDQRVLLAGCPAPVRCINSVAPFETKVDLNAAVAPGFKAVFIDGAVHFPMLERPGVFNARLREVVSELAGTQPESP